MMEDRYKYKDQDLSKKIALLVKLLLPFFVIVFNMKKVLVIKLFARINVFKRV